MGVWAPETVEAVAVYQLPAAEEADTLLGGDTPPSDIGTNPNDSHNPGPETRDSVPTIDNGSDMELTAESNTGLSTVPDPGLPKGQTQGQTRGHPPRG